MFKGEELTPSALTAAAQVALNEAFGFTFGAENRRRLCFDPRNACEAKARYRHEGRRHESRGKFVAGFVEVTHKHTDTHTRAISNRQDLGLRLTMWRTVMHCQSDALQLFGWRNKKAPSELADDWLCLTITFQNASRLLNLTKQSVWVWAAAVPKLLSTSAERCKTTKCNTSLMPWLLMFSRRWSTVYPRHPSQAPTCLFAFSLHLYS